MTPKRRHGQPVATGAASAGNGEPPEKGNGHLNPDRFRHLEIVQKFYDRRNSLESLAHHLDPDFVLREAASLPYGGDFHGLAGYKELRRQVARVWSAVEPEFLDFTMSDSLVVAHIAVKFTSRDTGRQIAMPVIEVWRFQGGRVLEIIPYYWDASRVWDATGGSSPAQESG